MKSVLTAWTKPAVERRLVKRLQRMASSTERAASR